MFGPPLGFTQASTWPWVDHPASGLLHATQSPCSDSVSLRLRHSHALTSLHTVTRRLILQKARHHPSQGQALTACRSTVSGSVSLPSRGAFHHFPHGTRSLSVAISYLALEGGPPSFRQGFSCPAVLRYVSGAFLLSHTGLSPSSVDLPSAVPLTKRFLTPKETPYNPHTAETIWVWAVPRPLAATKGISVDFSSSRYLDGSVPWVLLYLAMCSPDSDGHQNRRVTPFGHPRIKGCLLLPEAFRSLPRPSSPDSSKASTMDPYSLDHIILNPFPR